MDITIFVIVFLALTGLAIGSFVNATVLRINQSQSLQGRSQCPHCHHTLYWYTLIPLLSYIGLRGRCLFCQQSISVQYPLVEAVTAGLFILLGIFFYTDPVRLTIYLILVSICLAIFLSDYLFSTIPDVFSLSGMVIALIGQVLLGGSMFDIGVGVALGGGIFLAQYVLSKGRWVGSGDIRLGVMLGVMLAWPNIVVCLFLAYVAGALVALPLLLIKSKKMGDALPFGTFLTGAGVVALLWGNQIVHWYLYAFLKLPI
ncbi:MAG: prepilin peptidase [Patescibacteria group bacterium]|jgi:prepilin signal peptidase PulO-like enzyme (type II secretory pathway)